MVLFLAILWVNYIGAKAETNFYNLLLTFTLYTTSTRKLYLGVEDSVSLLQQPNALNFKLRITDNLSV